MLLYIQHTINGVTGIILMLGTVIQEILDITQMHSFNQQVDAQYLLHSTHQDWKKCSRS